jgi:hypothetical protein
VDVPKKGDIMKTKYKFFIAVVISTLLFSSCLTTSNYVVSESANIEKYRFASISEVMGYTGSPVLMDMDVRIYDIVAKSGLSMIGEKEINNLSEEDKDALLLVKYSVTQNSDESVVSITFVDFLTLKPVATCRGAWGFGWGKEQDLEVALDKVMEQIKKLFEKK